MRKFLLPLLPFLLCFGGLASANGQTRLQTREAEWKNYALPQTNFTRQVNADKNFVFRVPTDWKQTGQGLNFTGPHSATFEVMIQKVPEGYPLDDYFAATLQTVRDLTGGGDSILTRKTEFQDLEARELFLETSDPEGVLIRSTSWLTIQGPRAVMFNLKVPAAHASEVEPYFKAIVQSVMFVPIDYPAFEAIRNTTLKSATTGPLNELENIVASLNEPTVDRGPAITRLASIFSSTPDLAIDLLLDRRPLVRATAAQAVARSNNNSLAPFLWELLDDQDPLVSEAAARSLASSPDVVAKILEVSMSGFKTEPIARVWPFMPKEKRTELLQLIFKETAVRRPEPPPAVAPPPVRREVSKPKVTISLGEMTAVKRGKPIELIAIAGQDANVQLGALTLLVSIPPDEFKLPLAQLMASNYDPLLTVGLQVALARAETLPVAPLLQLVSSRDQQVSCLAAQNLALSAGVANIPQIQALISKDGSRKFVDDQLKTTIAKINFRQELSSAKTEDEQRQIISKALSDPALAEFAWRYHCEATVSGCGPNAGAKPARNLNIAAIKPFAENLFPKRVRHYTAIPNPRQAVQKFYETLHGLQLDSPRAQSNLVLMMSNVRRMLGQELSAPIDAEALIDYTGIDPDAPIALGSWTAPNAPDSLALAQRKAIVLRVKDRARFERAIEKYQRVGGSFTRLTDIVAIGSRAIAALPALLPFTAQAAAVTTPSKPAARGPLLHYSFIGAKEWNGLPIKTIEHVWLNSNWFSEGAATYIAYLGDTAIVAPDLATIRDLLLNAGAESNRQFLADNREFRQAIESRGDIVYFSDLKAVMAEAGGENKNSSSKINERGALNFSSSSWENSHQVVFDESEWSKPLLPFQPKELTAPRDLLPASTFAYYLMKIDLPALWATSAKNVFSKSQIQALPALSVLDFNKEVLPELGPECGVVMTELPDLRVFSSGTIALFCKLKSNKLADALRSGKLLRGVGPTTDVAELKVASDSFFFAVRNGFLVVSNHATGLAAFDRKTNLAATRDYSRSVEKVPGSVIAFGGYNLEAAVAAASNTPMEGIRAQAASLLFSVASAFHSQNFYATATAGAIEAHSSVAMDREGRYAVADFSSLPGGTNITYAVLEPHGVQITDQKRLSSVALRIRAKAPGPIDNIKDEIKTPDQIVEQKSATELLLTVAARRAGTEKAFQLPINNPEMAQYLKATAEFAADKKEVINKAREIAGKDRDAWSVARKLADWVNKNLEWKLVISADPVQTLATREADCSEFSALFVAMARSLGLPSRTVSGLAYSGNSFGGHAWVEVWIGRWIELDPTWGTSFVDATHVRNTTNSLLTSAALNLIELEVLETKRTAADFQKTPRALAEHLVKAIPTKDKPEIEAAIDLPTLTDEYMGAGAWAKLNHREREQMWSAYRRVVLEIIGGYKETEFDQSSLRLLHAEEKGDTAEAICLAGSIELLVKLRFVRRDDAWRLVDFVQADTGLSVATEMLGPTIAAIEKIRAGEKPSANSMSDFVRLLFLLDKDATKALTLADELLKSKPKNQGLRQLKAMALINSKKLEAAETLLTELSDEKYAPAVYRLAVFLSDSEDEKDTKKSLEMYQRYTSLEPHDPRGFRGLAIAYDNAEQPVQAEAAYRQALEVDPAETSNYLNLIEFLILHDRVGEIRPLLAAGENHQGANEDFFGTIIQDLYFQENSKLVEKFAASEPARMKSSALANLSLGRILTREERYSEAERLLNTAAQLDRKSADPHIALAILHRKQSRWSAALKSADLAEGLNAEDSEAHYQRACALARLGRIKDAMSALSKSVELDPDQAEYIADEADLKSLASLPAFKKLLPEPEKAEKPQP
jgi:Flp pilus assembly protein TadD